MNEFASSQERGAPRWAAPPVGVLALQGAFREHIELFQEMGVGAREVRLPEEMEGLSGLVIPGGESTTMGLLAREYRLVEALEELGKTGAIWGTCAGAILLSRGLPEPHGTGRELRLGLMAMAIQRNAMGRQVESFRVPLRVPALDSFGKGQAPFPAVFIRAPVIKEVDEGSVEVLARLDDGRIVAARQGRHLATAFHPELTGDHRFHRFFLSLVQGGDETGVNPARPILSGAV